VSQILVADIKPLVSLSQGDTGHDTLLTGYIASAEAMFARHLRRDLDAEFPGGWPADILQALRVQISHWYDQSFGGSMAGTNAMHQGVKDLLAPHRNLGG